MSTDRKYAVQQLTTLVCHRSIRQESAIGHHMILACITGSMCVFRIISGTESSTYGLMLDSIAMIRFASLALVRFASLGYVSQHEHTASIKSFVDQYTMLIVSDVRHLQNGKRLGEGTPTMHRGIDCLPSVLGANFFES